MNINLFNPGVSTVGDNRKHFLLIQMLVDLSKLLLDLGNGWQHTISIHLFDEICLELFWFLWSQD